MKILLKPIAQIVPNRKGIEAPSRIENPIAISQETFINEYADNARSSLVSFSQDGVSDPQRTTVFIGLDPMKGRYIVKQ